MSEAHEDRKERMRRRYRRQQRHVVSHEEQKERKAKRRERGRWHDENDAEAEFAKMHRRSPDSLQGGARRQSAATPHSAERQGTVSWLGRGRARVLTGAEEFTALLAPELAAAMRTAIAVGDEAVVHERSDAEPLLVSVLPRRSELARREGTHDERHVLAANIDRVVLVLSAERLRIGLVDRLVVATEGSGAELLLCVNKIDLPHEATELDAALAPYVRRGVPVLRCSARTGAGIETLHAELAGRTAAFVGHSGVGKSSLLNRLDPEQERATGSVREQDGRGRHTTSASSLRRLPCGTQLVDTPGVRLFGLIAEASDAAVAFPEIAELAGACRFRDCHHVHEPGCAVRAAMDVGALDAGRYAAYLRLVQTPG